MQFGLKVGTAGFKFDFFRAKRSYEVLTVGEDSKYLGSSKGLAGILANTM